MWMAAFVLFAQCLLFPEIRLGGEAVIWKSEQTTLRNVYLCCAHEWLGVSARSLNRFAPQPSHLSTERNHMTVSFQN